MSDVSQILEAVGHGDAQAAAQLLPAVYDDLRRLAANKLAREAPGQTLQATALVHEAYLRLQRGDPDQRWDHRGHFFQAAAEAMRRILVDRARHKQSLKRGGDRQRQEAMLEADLAISISSDELLDLDEALEKLVVDSPDEAALVKLRYFAGLSIEEAADTLGITRNVAYRYWNYAKAFLTTALAK